MAGGLVNSIGKNAIMHCQIQMKIIAIPVSRPPSQIFLQNYFKMSSFPVLPTFTISRQEIKHFPLCIF